MSDNIPPFEIQREILKRVPDVKSLLQFRSVSKSWKSLIDSPGFIVDYNPQPRRHHIFLRYHDHFIKCHYVSFIDNDNNDSCFAQHNVPISVQSLGRVGVYGSSEGLFFLYRHSNKGIAVLLNPAIRKTVTIVVPNVTYEFTIGFGVSPYSSDPKLVKIQRFGNVSDLKPRQVEVYSLSTGEWRTLSEDLPSTSIAFNDYRHVAIGKYIFWHVEDSKYENGMRMEREMIMVFDMISDKFMEICLPDYVVTQKSGKLCLDKIRESLVVVESYFNYSVQKQFVHIWMMEGGVSDSFTKMYTIIRPDDARFSLLAFRNNSHPIIRMHNSSEFKGSDELVVYEPDSEQFTPIGAFGSTRTKYAGSYMETLLLLDH